MWRYFTQIIWVGMTKFLGFFYALVGFLIFIEINRFWTLGLKLSDAAALIGHYKIFRFNVFSILSFAVLLPILITGLKYLLRNKIRGKIYETSRFSKHFVFLFHCFFFLSLIVLYLLSPYMQYLSGYALDHGSVRFLYTSNYHVFVNGIAWPTYVFVVFWFLFQLVLRVRLSGKDPFHIIKHYNLWLALANPEGELYPVYNRHLNFNAGAISPEIRFVSRRVRQEEAEYQENVPGSRDAAAHLQQLANRCRDYIFQLLQIDNSQHKYQIEFHTGTSRAIELAINRLPSPVKILISPYEHPSEVDVIKWVEKPGSTDVAQIIFPPDIYHKNWELQEAEIGKQLKQIVTDPTYNYLFVISEVCFANGMIVPIERLLKEFRNIKVGEQEPKINFLIDASHSVGNFQGSFGSGTLELDSKDAYVFGSHKWLLSPEPCGVLLTQNPASEGIKTAYDVWKDELPVTTIGLARIGSFLSSLELILHDDRLQSFMALSTLMKEDFIKLIEEKFLVVGAASNQKLSNMIAIKPKDGYQWVKPSEDSLQACLSRAGVNCKVIDKGDDSLWVRLTFLYFITYSDIKQLRARLESSIKPY